MTSAGTARNSVWTCRQDFLGQGPHMNSNGCKGCMQWMALHCSHPSVTLIARICTHPCCCHVRYACLLDEISATGCACLSQRARLLSQLPDASHTHRCSCYASSMRQPAVPTENLCSKGAAGSQLRRCCGIHAPLRLLPLLPRLPTPSPKELFPSSLSCAWSCRRRLVCVRSVAG